MLTVRSKLNHSQKIITKCDGIITNCDRYYKVRWIYYKLRQVLQSAMTITNCDSTVTYPRALVMFHPLSTVYESSLTLS